MFALVEFVDDSEKEIVNVSCIKRFDSENVGYNKKYKVQWNDGNFYDAFILIIGETTEDVEKKRDGMRIRKPNRKFAESDVATSSEAEPDDKRQKRKGNIDDEFSKQFEDKLSQMKAIRAHETDEVAIPDPDEALLDAADSKDTEAEKHGKTSQQKVKEKLPKKRNESSSIQTKEKGISEAKGHHDSTNGEERKGKKEDLKRSDSDSGAKEKNKNKDQIPSTSNAEFEMDTTVTGDKPPNCALALKSKSLIHSTEKLLRVPLTEVLEVSGTKKGNIEDSSSNKEDKPSKKPSKPNGKSSSKPIITSDKRLTTKIELVELQKTIASITAENKRYRELLKEKDAEITLLKERNTNLQVRVIDEFDEFRGIIKELRQVNGANVEHRKNNALFNVGYRREADNTIHIGRNVWLSYNVYDSIVCISRSNAQFVKNCAIAIFDTETLMASSVTGSVSNRMRKAKGEAAARPKLDSEKLLALKDIYQYYLQHTKKLDEVAIGFELNQVGTFVSQKIYELNRAKKKVTKTTQYVDGPDNPVGSDEENSERQRHTERSSDESE